MTHDRSADRHDLLSETEVRHVLERAARIEAGRGSLSIDELKRVAAEAGFSRGAVQQALAEVLEARNQLAPIARPAVDPRSAQTANDAGTARPPTRAEPAAAGRAWSRVGREAVQWLGRWMRRGAILMGSTALTVFSWRLEIFGMGRAHGAVLLCAGILLAASGMLALRHRWRGSQEAFQLDLAAVWIGYLLGHAPLLTSGLILWGPATTIRFAMPLLLWAGSAAIGGLIVGADIRRRPTAPSQTTTGA